MCTEEYELQSCSPEIELAWSKRGGRRVTATASRPIRQRTDEVCPTLPQLHPCMLTILFTSIHTIQSDSKTHVHMPFLLYCTTLGFRLILYLSYQCYSTIFNNNLRYFQLLTLYCECALICLHSELHFTPLLASIVYTFRFKAILLPEKNWEECNQADFVNWSVGLFVQCCVCTMYIHTMYIHTETNWARIEVLWYVHTTHVYWRNAEVTLSHPSAL